MKKILFTIVLALCFALLSLPALAAPWLVSDPMPPGDEVTKFRLSFDSGAYVDSAPDAHGAVRYDLAGTVEVIVLYAPYWPDEVLKWSGR